MRSDKVAKILKNVKQYPTVTIEIQAEPVFKISMPHYGRYIRK